MDIAETVCRDALMTVDSVGLCAEDNAPLLVPSRGGRAALVAGRFGLNELFACGDWDVGIILNSGFRLLRGGSLAHERGAEPGTGAGNFVQEHEG